MTPPLTFRPGTVAAAAAPELLLRAALPPHWRAGGAPRRGDILAHAPPDAGADSSQTATCDGITVTDACGVCTENKCCNEVAACNASADFLALEYCLAQTSASLCPGAFPHPWDLGAISPGMCPMDPNPMCPGGTPSPCCAAAYPTAWTLWESLFNCFDNPVYPGWCSPCAASARAPHL